MIRSDIWEHVAKYGQAPTMHLIRRAIIAICLMVFGGVHAACACPKVVTDRIDADITTSTSISHSQIGSIGHAPQSNHCDTSYGEKIYDCEQCSPIAVAHEATPKLLTAITAVTLPTISLPDIKSKNTFDFPDVRIAPARGPPLQNLSLVTLKIRLQN